MKHIVSAVLIIALSAIALQLGIREQRLDPSHQPEVAAQTDLVAQQSQPRPAAPQSRGFSSSATLEAVLFLSGQYSRSATWIPGDAVVSFTDHEKFPTGKTFSTAFSESTSYNIIDVASRGATELYVAGETRGGADVIERWIIDEPEGGYMTVYPGTMAGAGSPTAPYGPTLVVSGGGAHQPLGERRARGPAVKDELFLGNLGGIKAMTPSLDGRYIAVLTGGGDVVQLIPSDPYYVVSSVIASSSTTSALDSAECLWVGGLGDDVCIVAESYNEWDSLETTYMWDNGNDTVFNLTAEFGMFDPSHPYRDIKFDVALWHE